MDGEAGAFPRKGGEMSTQLLYRFAEIGQRGKLLRTCLVAGLRFDARVDRSASTATASSSKSSLGVWVLATSAPMSSTWISTTGNPGFHVCHGGVKSTCSLDPPAGRARLRHSWL
jgi:hypothetical protein